MRSVTIVDLLAWAYREELGKVAGAMADVSGGYSVAWGRAQEAALYGTMIDRSPNVYGMIPTSVYEGEPHADALLVGRAVRAIAGVEAFAPPADWAPFPEFEDMQDVLATEVRTVLGEWALRGDIVNASTLQASIVRSAIIGRGPDWTCEAPVFAPVMKWGNPAWFVARKAKDSLGRAYTYEADGYDRRKHRPMRGAYRKYRLVEPMRSSIMARLDWHVWQMSMLHLHSRLANHLSAHRLVPFLPEVAPWEIRSQPDLTC